MTHSTVTDTGNGINAVLYRVGRVVFAKITGTLSAAVSNGGTMLTIRSGYRPVEAFYSGLFVNSTSGQTRFAYNNNGTVVPNLALSKGASVQGYACYVCAAY